MITCAKAITSGYLPLGAVIVSARIQEPFWTEPGRAIFRHGFTYSGHPAACAAGLANLDLIEREELVDRVAEMESVLARAVDPLTRAAARQRGAGRARPAGRRRDRSRRARRRSGPGRADRDRLPRRAEC